MYASVIVDVTNKQINKAFEYKIPSHLEEIVEIGHRVLVPFGSRKVLGFVIDIHDESEFSEKLKDIYDVLDIKPIITKDFILLAKYMVDRYYSFYITCLKNMIPQSLRVDYLKKVHVLDYSKMDEDTKKLFSNDYYLIKPNDPAIKILKKYESLGIVEIIESVKDKGNKKLEAIVHLEKNDNVRSEKAKEIIKYLYEIKEDIPKKSLIDMGYSESSLKTLLNKGIISIYSNEIYRNPKSLEYEDKQVELNEKQTVAYNSILSGLNKNDVFLLHGVCGSGKTEIYLRIIEDVIKAGKDAIVLVPEISLTPQMTSRFKARFKEDVAVLHSRLSNGERYDEWRRILNGKAHVVVGARSAIFAPFKNLGIIIIDEEHELSYIQDTNPRYSAIDIAKFRAKYNNCPLVLGSATPRISDYTKAINKEYKLLELPKRVNNIPLEISEVVDMREELKNGNKTVFSASLYKALKETLLRNEQAIIFINRRGYSSFVMCRECGNTIDCPNCNMSLVYHKSTNRLKCHHCGYEIVNPTRCPVCNSTYIKHLGDGTEKALEFIKKEFPGAVSKRVDTDTMKNKNSYEEVFDDFRNKKIDILVGTQIIAKGLDFPNVSLVGVLNADIGLKMSEYNASEITYDLIEQVSGRAGRDKIKGKVIIQTYMKEHYAIKYAANHDYNGFYLEEIKNRRIMKCPPFVEYLEIIVASKNKDICFMEATKIKKSILKENYGVNILGPFEDYIFKLNNVYRYKLSIKFNDLDLKETLETINVNYQDNKDVNISIIRK